MNQMSPGERLKQIGENIVTKIGEVVPPMGDKLSLEGLPKEMRDMIEEISYSALTSGNGGLIILKKEADPYKLLWGDKKLVGHMEAFLARHPGKWRVYERDELSDETRGLAITVEYDKRYGGINNKLSSDPS